MADISKISPDGGTTEYNIKDADARLNKADKVSQATAGNLAKLDSNGNLVDSGKSADIIPSTATTSNKLSTASDISAIWSANARTGVHQWFDKSKAVGNKATVVQTATGLEVTGTEVGYTSAKTVMDNLPKNTDFRLSLTATTENGNKTVAIQGSNDKSTWTTILLRENISSLNEVFNTDSYDYIQFIMYAGSNSTPADSKVTYSDILLRLATDTDTTYTPYAMTNQQLTDMVTVKDLTGISFVDTYIDESTSEAFITRYGDIAELNIKLNVTTQIPTYTKFAENVPKYHVSGKSFSGFAYDNSNGNKGYRFYVDGAGTLNNHATAIPVGIYYISLVYICRD